MLVAASEDWEASRNIVPDRIRPSHRPDSQCEVNWKATRAKTRTDAKVSRLPTSPL